MHHIASPPATDFTSYLARVLAANPIYVVPGCVLVMGVDPFCEHLRHAFEAGVVHAARVQAALAELARQEAMEAAGPAGLKPHFDAIFGQNIGSPEKHAGGHAQQA